LAESIFAQVYEACESLDISLAGGHTEITVNLDRPIVCGTMLGEVAPERLITTANAKVGDSVLLIKTVPIEGTALIALERAEMLRARGYSAQSIGRAQRFLHDPGISVVAPARLAVETGGVHAMHDPTEGGVVSGLLEIARAAGTGLDVDLDAVPVLPEGRALCGEFGLDPLGTIASGAILLTAGQGDIERLSVVLQQAGYPASVIGQVTPVNQGLVARRGKERVPWPVFETDEITKIFA
jgi:hydrogenase expression/formation protein HypE